MNVADLARWTMVIDRRELAAKEAIGWRALHHNRMASDDIESIIIGWFHEDDPPECLNQNT